MRAPKDNLIGDNEEDLDKEMKRHENSLKWNTDNNCNFNNFAEWQNEKENIT